MLLVSTMWYDGGENVGTTEMYEKTLELEEIFSKGCQLCNTLDPVFGPLMGAMIKSRRVMQLTWI